MRICTEVLCRSLLAVEFIPKDQYVDAVEFYTKAERRLSLLYFFYFQRNVNQEKDSSLEYKMQYQ